MNKILCWDIYDFIAKLSHQLELAGVSVDLIESSLGVEFAMRDKSGNTKFLGDIRANSVFGHVDNDLEYWEDQEIAMDVFRVVLPQDCPEKYPVLVMTLFENGYDRLGKTSARIIEFVYLDDFKARGR